MLIAQIVAGSVDMAVSAAVLYVLLPAEARPNLPYFLVAYAGGILFGIVSHAPGGLGVFEATIIAALGREHSAETIAALIVYRLVYYAFPFVLGVTARRRPPRPPASSVQSFRWRLAPWCSWPA